MVLVSESRRVAELRYRDGYNHRRALGCVEVHTVMWRAVVRLMKMMLSQRALCQKRTSAATHEPHLSLELLRLFCRNELQLSHVQQRPG